jgi:hypothetical protein
VIAEDHGERCACLEGEKFGFQAAAIVDALGAEGALFDAWEAPGRPGLGPPGGV